MELKPATEMESEMKIKENSSIQELKLDECDPTETEPEKEQEPDQRSEPVKVPQPDMKPELALEQKQLSGAAGQDLEVPLAVESLQIINNINSLNDDCLREIFLRLPIKDRLAVSLVCERWEKVSYTAWNNMTHGQLCEFFMCEPNLTLNTVLRTLYRSIKYLKSCCLSLDHHTISDIDNNPGWQNKIFRIMERGRYLRSVLWDFEAPQNAIMGFFSAVIDHLEEIIILPTNNINIKLFANIVSKGLKLNELIWEMNPDCYNASDIPTLMKALPKTMEQIHIQSSSSFFMESILTNIHRFENLYELHIIGRKVKLNRPIHLSNVVFPRTLRVLNINEMKHQSSLNFLSEVHGLKKLTIVGGSITKEDARDFVENNKEIEEIDIGNIFGLSDEILNIFARLPLLKHLSLGGLTITGTYLNRFTTLKKLVLDSCFNISERNMCDFITHAHSLRILLIEDGQPVTANMMQIISRVPREERLRLYVRRNNGPMEVHSFPEVQGDELYDSNDEYNELDYQEIDQDEYNEMLEDITEEAEESESEEEENTPEEGEGQEEVNENVIEGRQVREQNQVENHREEE